jgi:hypothetical protein
MTERPDPLTPIHKGLRSLLYELSARTQRHDFADVAATETLVHQFERGFATARSMNCALCIMSAHAGDEDRFVFPDAARYANDLVARLILDHHDLTRREVAIAVAGHELLGLGTPGARLVAGVRLNQALNELLGAYFEHMNREETELLPLMHRHRTDAELDVIRGTIVANAPPEQMLALLGWMLPSMNATELSILLTGARSTLPPPAFARLTALCDAKIDPDRWSDVKLRLGL